MRIIIVSDWFSEKMGYAENCLPKALARLGHEVHLITSTAQVYFNHPDYDKIYKGFLGENIVAPQVKKINGFTLYRLPFKYKNDFVLKGLIKLLFKIKPDLVHTFDTISHTNYILSICKPVLGYKLFAGNHIVASVFAPAQSNYWPWKPDHYFKNNILRKSSLFFLKTFVKSLKFNNSLQDSKKIFINSSIDICYAATIDSADIAVRFYNLPRHKVRVAELGVDTRLFFPASTEKEITDRKKFRIELNYSDENILCIYTGRLTEDKNPLCLAKAIDKLHKTAENFHALFIGSGPQEKEIRSCSNCKVIPFVPFPELGDYYRAADIGVWPMQESTSMLDASACALPIIISDKVQSPERTEGNGISYRENDIDDLADKIFSLKDKDTRRNIGRKGVDKIIKRFSWDIIAADRINDYRTFVNNRK
jgi:glycosyltransferase involved in cell wall biosynthesis